MRYRAAAVVLALAAAVAIGQVPMYSDYPWGLLNNGTDQGPVWNLDCKGGLWCHLAGYGNGVIELGDGGVLPITVLFAQDAGQALLAGFAAYAADAGLANRSSRADFADDAGFAIFAGDAGRSFLANFSDYAADAGYSQSSGLAGVATYALDAGLASKANVADFARDAGSAANADVATYALDAGLSVAALWAGDAGYSNSAGLAFLATYALDAGLASKAFVADFARDAGSAASADLATYALDAGLSVAALWAGDAGLSIASLYAADAGLSQKALVSDFARDAGSAASSDLSTYALDAGNVQCTGCIDAARIASGAVTTAKIGSGAVTSGKLDDGPGLSAYDEATVAGISSRATATNCTKGSWDGATGYIRFTVSTAVTNPQVSTTIGTGTSTNATTTTAVVRYRLSGGFTSSAPSTIRAINNSATGQTADAAFVTADGNWHTATFDISAWTTAGTFRVDLLMPSTLGTTGFWDISYIGTGIAASGPGALVSYQGSVGVNNPTPAATLHVTAANTTAPSLTWNATAGQILRNENSELAIGLSSVSPNPLYLQGRTSTSTARNLSLQPLGGNVGVGDTSPDAVFKTNTINGGFVGMFQSSSSASAAYPELSVRNYSAGGGFPVLGTYMARGTSVSPASPNSGDSLGAWVAYGRTLSSFTEGGRIQWTTTAAPGTSTLTTALDLYTSNAAASAAKARLSAAGKLYIGGAVDAEELLEVRSGSSAYGLLHSNGTIKVGTYISTEGQVGTKSNHDLALFTNNGAARLRVTSTGEVRLPDYAGGGTTGASIDNNGRIIRTPSDERLKENISDLPRGLDSVLKMRPVRFQWRDKQAYGDRWDIGFIAQEMIATVPEAVGRTPEGTYSLDYGKLIAVVVGAIQELFDDRTWMARRIQELEDRAQKAEERLSRLEALLGAVDHE